MKDAYGREIDYMRISVTDRCNLRCRYCMPAEGVPAVRHEDILTFDEIVRAVRCASELGIRDVRLTGGEPLVRRGLPELVRMLRGIPGIRRIGLTTNGTLLAGSMEELYRAGVRYLNISLDTLDPSFYAGLTRGGRLEDALAGLEAAAQYLADPHGTGQASGERPEDFRGTEPGGSPETETFVLKADCVLTGLPEQKLTDVASLARDRRIHVRFIELMPVGCGADALSQRKAPFGMEQAMAALGREFGEPERDRDFRPGSGPAVYWRFPGFAGRIGFIAPLSRAFCAACSRLRLTSEGRLRACLAYEESTDLKDMMRRGCTDGELTDAIRRTILSKPARHDFSGEAGRKEAEKIRTMNQIGG